MCSMQTCSPCQHVHFNVLPWIFLGPVVLAVIRYVYLRRNRPDVIARIGDTEMDTLGGIG